MGRGGFCLTNRAGAVMTNARAGGGGELCQIGMGLGKRKMDRSNKTETRITNDAETKRNTKQRFLTPLILPRLLLLFLVTILSLCSLFAGDTLGQDKVSLPLAFRVDMDSYLKIGLYLKCEGVEQNMRYQDFSSSIDSKATVFKQVVETIRNDNLTSAYNLTGRTSSATEEKFKAKLQAGMNAYRWCLGAEATGNDFEHLNVIGRFDIGNRSILGVETKAHAPAVPESRVCAMYFKDSGGQIVWDVDSPPAVLSLVGESLRQRAKLPEDFTIRKDVQTEYEMPIPGSSVGKAAFLQFDGRRSNVKLISDSIDESDEVLSLYQRQYRAACDRRLSDIVEMYTSKSREWFSMYMTDYPEHLEKYLQELSDKERVVRFVIEAEPLFIVLSQLESRKNLRTDFIIRDPSDGKLKLTSFRMVGFMKQLFNDPEAQRFLYKFVAPQPEEMSIERPNKGS